MIGAQVLLSHTWNAGEDFSSAQYRFVGLSSGEVVLIDSGVGIGAIQNDPEEDEQANVALVGIAIVEASTAILEGAYVGATTDGKAVTTSATGVVLGIALEAAAEAGDLISVLLTPGNTIVI